MGAQGLGWRLASPDRTWQTRQKLKQKVKCFKAEYAVSTILLLSFQKMSSNVRRMYGFFFFFFSFFFL